MTKMLTYGIAALALSSISAVADEEMVRAEVLPGWRDADGTHMAAVRVQLAPGWKTFWRAPGDAGIPPRFVVDGSNNVDALQPIWPRPEVFETGGMRSVGYAREVIIPVVLTPSEEGAPIDLDGTLEIGICADVCVPASLDITATLPPAGERDARIVASLVDVPFTAEEAGVSAVRCFMGPVQYGMGLRAEITLPNMSGEENVVVEASDPMIWIAEPRAWWEGDVLVAETELSHYESRGFTLTQDALRFTVIADGQAVDIQGCETR